MEGKKFEENLQTKIRNTVKCSAIFFAISYYSGGTKKNQVTSFQSSYWLER